MVRAYKTDVQNPRIANDIVDKLLQEYPDYRVTFDLEDCDHVLRVEGNEFETEHITGVVGKFGSSCEELV